MAWVKKPNEELLEEYPNLKDFLPYLDVQNAESPRGAILVACSYLDEQLKAIIAAFLVDKSDRSSLLDGFNAPLGTFSARITMAHCLGLISDFEKSDCNTLRKIRNEFAHKHRVSFEDQKIVDLCGKLHHSAKDYGDVVVGAYGAFSSGAVGLAMNFVNRAHYVSKQRIKQSTWPY